MKKVKEVWVLSLALFLGLSLLIIAEETPSDVDIEKAKSKYIEAKCNQCHAHSDFGVEAKNKSASNKAPDFSKINIEYDKDFLKKYLNKEESVNNKKHPVAYKGNDEDLNLIMAFILLKKQEIEEKKE